MPRPLGLTLGFWLLLAAVPLLAACHTTAGVGQDISAGGHALTGAADRSAPQ